LDSIDKLQGLIIEEIKEKLDQPNNALFHKVHSIENKNRLKQLYVRIIHCTNQYDIINSVENITSVHGKNALRYQQNYDAAIKYIAQEFRGKTLEIFGIKSARIVDVFTFEPIEIHMQTGRLDLIFRDETGACYHVEEQRNMTEDDFYRCCIYHFQAARQYTLAMTDILLISGQKHNLPERIQTKSGYYEPVIIDLTSKDGLKRLRGIKEEILKGNYDNLIELIFLPLYGDIKKEERQDLAKSVISYEIGLLKKDQIYEKLVILTLIMCNKILDTQTLHNFYEEAKNMLDILEIAREDGEQTGLNQGMLQNSREMLMEALKKQFNVIPARFVETIKSIDQIETLKSLFWQALECDNHNTFEKQLMFATA
jgi:hypothetical protein